jgi:hemin uptake protein HemP
MRDDPARNDPKKPTPAATGVSRSDTAARTTSEALLGAARELIIEHHGREYRLRLTQQGKLILTA